MASPHETALLALQAALAGHGATIIREPDLPLSYPDGGLVNLAPANPVEEGVRLGTGVREWSREVDLEHVVQGADAVQRDADLDLALVRTAALLLADQTLGGAVDWLELSAPKESESVPMPGAETLKGAVLVATLFYETTHNPME